MLVVTTAAPTMAKAHQYRFQNEGLLAFVVLGVVPWSGADPSPVKTGTLEGVAG
jgi:hypothetical protein